MNICKLCNWLADSTSKSCGKCARLYRKESLKGETFIQFAKRSKSDLKGRCYHCNIRSSRSWGGPTKKVYVCYVCYSKYIIDVPEQRGPVSLMKWSDSERNKIIRFF